jgi:RNA polymerase sigma-70 factor (ECF subfamily)
MGSDAAVDQALVAQYLAGRDETAFIALYRRHTPALFGLATRLAGGERQDAEEIVQEVWLRAAERLSAFRWESSLRTWLSGIVVNGWREKLRSRRREVFLEEDAEEMARSGLPPSSVLRVDVGRAVAELPDGFRTVLLLHDVEGFTHEEIARLLEIGPGTSKSQLARARQAMRRRLSYPPELAAKGDRDERTG